MKFKKATQEDLDFVRQNPFEGVLKNYPYLQIPDENCIAIIFQDKIVGVGGLSVIWEGVGWLWLMLTADCKKDGLFGIIALSAIKDKIDELLKDNNIKRAQATVRTDFPQAIKMIEFLGFKNETPDGMEAYCPDGAKSYLYSKVT